MLGVSPWSSRLSLYADKTLDVDDEELSEKKLERFRWGHLLERVVLDEVTARTGIEFIRAPQTVMKHHRDWPRVPMFSTPDSYVRGEQRLGEVKTVETFAQDRWKDGLPLDINIQCQHQMEVHEREGVIVAALMGLSRLELFEVKRHDKFIDQLRPEVCSFWHDHVTPRVMPAPDGSSASVNALERLHPNDSGDEILLSDEAVEIDLELAEIKERMKADKKRQKELETEIKAMIGENTWGRLPDGSGRFSWKTQTRKAYSVEEASFRVLRRGK